VSRHPCLSSFLLLAAPFVCSAADTVAVLPLFGAKDPATTSLGWIGESVAETIHESLGSAGLMVLAREDREEVYRRLEVHEGSILTKATVINIGVTLDAGAVIFGEFEVASDRTGAAPTLKSSLKLRVHVIDLRKLHENPVIEESGPLEQLSGLEMKVSFMLLKQFAPDTAGSEEEFLRAHPAVKVEAMESYVRGLMASSQEQRIKLFAQAARLDDHFSPPDFQLGKLYFQRKEYKTAEVWLRKVSKTDLHYLEASFLMGICRYYDGDFENAIGQFRMVAAELPLNEVYNDLGAALSRSNDPSAADDFRKALDGDQADPDYWFNLGFALWKRGDFTQAATQFRGVLERSRDDQDATYFLGRSLRGEGPRAGEARSEGRERIKTTFEDSAFRQLQAELKSKK
jgi:tetratricopeptide (TPR) repeat protein